MSLLSVFTPTNNPQHLLEAYHSLLQQPSDCYEWVIVPNGGVTSSDIPELIRQDPRVRILQGPDTDKIGALKRFACDQCNGDVFIELDHDDMLIPGALDRIADKAKSGFAFIYGDCAAFNDKDLRPWSYHKSHGWEFYRFRVYGCAAVATVPFPVTPSSLCQIYYSPDHVRCWTRAAYMAAGGHNPKLSVADDHDLMCRTYLTRAAFEHTGGCDYLYRAHPGNTVKKRGKDISGLQNANRHKYLKPLVIEWCRRSKLQRADLGQLRQEKKWMPGFHLPFAKDTLGQLCIGSELADMTPDNQVQMFNEAYRVLAPGGFLHLDTRSYSLIDPKHFSDAAIAAIYPLAACRFQLLQRREYATDGVAMLAANLVALKGQRQPGPVFI
jgi:glycosyltransferase involved in cell wall biosynthesis